MGHHIDDQGRFQEFEDRDLKPDKVVIDLTDGAAYVGLLHIAHGYQSTLPEFANDLRKRVLDLHPKSRRRRRVRQEGARMKIERGNGTTKYGPGVNIRLTGAEMARAIDLFLYAQGVFVQGARTITYKGKLLKSRCEIYVDPSGRVSLADGNQIDGRGGDTR